MKQLTMLAQGAIGYDAGRGDQISVENISFDENRGRPTQSLPERLLAGASGSQALLKYATILAAMLGLIFFVIRPIAARGQPMAAQAALGAGGAPGQEAVLPVFSSEDLVLEAQKKRAQTLHDGVIESINSDPALSAKLLHSWIYSE
jgi:flagellar M-ring protein FliF